MSRLELRVVIAGLLAATVVLGAVACAAFGQATIAAVLAIYALGVGGWLYHAVERLVVARRISTVRSVARPFSPLLPVMGAIMGLTQAVVRALSDVTEEQTPPQELSIARLVERTRFGRRAKNGDTELDR